MLIFGYAKALKEANEEIQKLTKKLKDAYVEMFNLHCEIKTLNEKINKQKQELKNSTYKWK